MYTVLVIKKIHLHCITVLVILPLYTQLGFTQSCHKKTLYIQQLFLENLLCPIKVFRKPSISNDLF